MAEVAQPLHPDIIPRLDPEYIAFHNAHIAHIIPPHTLPWDASLRSRPPVPGSREVVEVGAITDFALSKSKIRAFTPKGELPSGGWPVFIWYHGGGWTLGNINTENAFASRVCRDAKCVVVTSDYRLGPEEPYPAAVEDALETLQWVYEKGRSELNVNRDLISVGGSSAGGNLAAIISLKAASLNPPIPLVSQVLIVPVTDNTASETGEPYKSWLENANTPWLNVGRMLWFRRNYLPNPEDLAKWDSSPIFAPNELLAKSPPTWIAVMELDILKDEGLAYGEKLKQVGVEVSHKVYANAPHPILAMDSTVLSVGRELISDITEVVAKALGTA